jgi:hypothetical protein
MSPARELQHPQRRPRFDGQPPIEVAQLQLACLEGQRQLAAFQHFAVAVLEDRQQDPALELRGDRIPVDVEILCKW